MRRRCRRNFVLAGQNDGTDPSINWESEVAKLEAHEGAILTRCHQPLSHRPQGLGAASSPADRATGRIPAPAYPATTGNRPSSPHTAPVPLAAPSGTQPTAGERFASHALRACSIDGPERPLWAGMIAPDAARCARRWSDWLQGSPDSLHAYGANFLYGIFDEQVCRLIAAHACP